MSDVVAARSDKSQPLSPFYASIGSPELSPGTKDELDRAQCVSELPKSGAIAKKPTSQPKPSVATTQKEETTKYEVWLVARKPNEGPIPKPSDSGHSWIALVKRDYTTTKTFKDGVLQTQEENPKNDWNVDTTYGFWDRKENPLVIDEAGNDRSDTEKLIRGESISKRGFAVRKARISKSRVDWIKGGAYREAGCDNYFFGAGVNGTCNCADYSTREWHVLTSKWEDFRIRALTWQLTLDSLVDSINEKNQKDGGYLDGGKTWD
jgi:hypothetical protein